MTPPAVRGAPPFAISPRGQTSRYLKILVYGPPGVGKTTLAASAADVPGMCKVMYVDAEGGDMTTEDNDRIKNSAGIDHVRIKTFNMVPRIQEFLLSHCNLRTQNTPETKQKMIYNESWLRGIDPAEIKEPTIYNTVILDTLTEINQYCMYGLLGIDQTKLLDAEKDQINSAQWGEYQKNNMAMQLLVRAFRDLPMHIIITAHQSYQQDEMKRFHYTPALTGKLAGQVQGMVDIVGRLIAGQITEQAGKVEQPRRLFVQPVERFDAKNRRASFKGTFFDDPTMPSIMKAIGLLQ